MRVHLLHAAPLAAEGGSNRLGLQALFVLGVLLLVVALFGAMRRAWARRAEQQEEELDDLPEPPAETGTVLAAPLRGMYLGTVDAGHWLEWISAGGPGGRAGAYVTVYSSGVQVDRAGSAFWIPREAVRGARLERAHAGKVAGPGRLVVIAWSFDGHELETGFRGEDRARQPKVVRAVHDLIGPAPAVPAEGEITNPRGIQRGRLRLRTRADAGAQPPSDRGARLPTPRLPRSPRQPVDQPGPARNPGTAAYPGARPYADPARRGGKSAPVADPNNSPATTPIPLGARSRQTAPEQPYQPPPQPFQLQQPYPPQQQHQHVPPNPAYPPQPSVVAPQDSEAAYVDPLTSPLGQVVRRMRDDR